MKTLDDNHPKEEYFTTTFTVDPALNDGFSEVFRQGNEPWWWYDSPNKTPAVGPVPNFTGAKFKSLHRWTELVVGV